MTDYERAREDAARKADAVPATAWPFRAVDAVRHESWEPSISVRYGNRPPSTHRTVETLACGHENDWLTRYPAGPGGRGGYIPVTRRHCRECAIDRLLA
jgi:hypothetical protein